MTERPNGASASAPLDHITQPVLNRPHEEPSRYWQLAEDNTSTGVAVKGRRPSQYLTIVRRFVTRSFRWRSFHQMRTSW